MTTRLKKKSQVKVLQQKENKGNWTKGINISPKSHLFLLVVGGQCFTACIWKQMLLYLITTLSSAHGQQSEH